MPNPNLAPLAPAERAAAEDAALVFAACCAMDVPAELTRFDVAMAVKEIERRVDLARLRIYANH